LEIRIELLQLASSPFNTGGRHPNRCPKSSAKELDKPDEQRTDEHQRYHQGCLRECSARRLWQHDQQAKKEKSKPRGRGYDPEE
jgi:hypothetical protein